MMIILLKYVVHLYYLPSFRCAEAYLIAAATDLWWKRKITWCLLSGLLPWVKLVDNFDAQYSYVTNEGTVFTFHSNLDAPRYCLINIDIQKPERQHWTTLIPQHDKDVLGEMKWNFFFAEYAVKGRVSFVGHICSLSSLQKNVVLLQILHGRPLSPWQLSACVRSCENSTKLQKCVNG